jgi:hypothetical protein
LVYGTQYGQPALPATARASDVATHIVGIH